MTAKTIKRIVLVILMVLYYDNICSGVNEAVKTNNPNNIRQQLNLRIAEITFTSLKLEWDKTNADGYVVLLREKTSGSKILTDRKIYKADIYYSYGDIIKDSDWFCVYNGTQTFTLVNGLAPGREYEAVVIEYSNTSAGLVYNTVTFPGGIVSFKTSKILLNEIDVYTNNRSGFIELYSENAVNINLDGLVLVFYDGMSQKIISKHLLNGYTTNNSGYCLINDNLLNDQMNLFSSGNASSGIIAVYYGKPEDYNFGNVFSVNRSSDIIAFTKDSEDKQNLQTVLPTYIKVYSESDRGDANLHSLQRVSSPGGELDGIFVTDLTTPGNVNMTFPIIELSGNNRKIPRNNDPDINNNTVFEECFIENRKISKEFTIINKGTDVLKIDSILIRHDSAEKEFEVKKITAGDIQPGDSLTFAVEFTPKTRGNKNIEMVIKSDDYLGDYKVNLSATVLSIKKPVIQSSEITAEMTGCTEAGIKWKRGDGQKCVIFISEATHTGILPVNDKIYGSDNTYGNRKVQGDSLLFCIGNGEINNLQIKGLKPETEYLIKIFEYNESNNFTIYNVNLSADNSYLLKTRNILINEIDSDTPGIDKEEFIELYDGGAGNTSLNGLSLTLINGGDNKTYIKPISLNGYKTDTKGFFLLGNKLVTGAEIIIPDNQLQNGADAAAIINGEPAEVPSGSFLEPAKIIDIVVYDTDDNDDPDLLSFLKSGEPQVNENGRKKGDIHSIQRIPDGAGGNRSSKNFICEVPTPKSANKVYPEVLIEGNKKELKNNDTLYSSLNYTLLKKTKVITGENKYKYFITNKGLNKLNIDSIYSADSNEKNFTVITLGKMIIPVDSTISFEIKFKPLSSGIKNGSIIIKSNDPVNAVFRLNLRGEGIKPDILVKSDNNIINHNNTDYKLNNNTDVGILTVNADSAPFKYILYNKGTDTLTVSDILIDSNKDSVICKIVKSPKKNILPGDSTDVIVTFTPLIGNKFKAGLKLISNDVFKPEFRINIIGKGGGSDLKIYGRGIYIPNNDLNSDTTNGTDFGRIKTGEKKKAVFKIKNEGNNESEGIKISIQDDTDKEFRITDLHNGNIPKLGASGDSADFTIEFVPVSKGIKIVKVLITSTVTQNNTYVFALKGVCFSGPYLSVKYQNNLLSDSSFINTGENIIGREKNLELVFKNEGEDKLTITRISLLNKTDSVYTLSNYPDSVLSPGDSSRVALKILSSSAGIKQSVLSINSNTEKNNSYRIYFETTIYPDYPEIKETGRDTLTYLKADSSLFLFAIPRISSKVSNYIESATIRFSENYLMSEDTLTYPKSKRKIKGSYNIGEGTLKLNGTATLTEYEEALKLTAYFNKNTIAPDTLAKQIIITVSDSLKTSNELLKTIIIKNIKSAPEINLLPEIRYPEDTVLKITKNDFRSFINDKDTKWEDLKVTLYSEDKNINIANTWDTVYQFSSPLNWYGKSEIFLAVNDGFNLVQKKINLEVLPVYDSIKINSFPYEIKIKPDSTIRLNLWNLIDDPDTPDSLINFTFNYQQDKISYNFNKDNGNLAIDPQDNITGLVNFGVNVKTSNKEVSFSLKIEITGITSVKSSEKIPDTFLVRDNFPNPFNETTTIEIELPEPANLYLEIFNILGEKISDERLENLQAGRHRHSLYMKNFANGQYILKISSGSNQKTLKIVKIATEAE